LSYIRLVPSLIEYADKFSKLDSLDFKIIRNMCRYGVSNLSRLSKIIGVPQQTLSYRVRKFDEEKLVHFRAIINEPKLGLKSYSILASIPSDRENFSSRALTCFPLWRYLALLEGWKHGSYVRYAIPLDKERDLKAFLAELKKRELISDFTIVSTTGPYYPLLNLDFYAEKGKIPIFNWDKWLQEYDSFPEEKLEDPINYEKIRFDIYDLIILRCLEINARMTQREIVREMARILNESEYKKFIPLVSRRIRERIKPHNLIRGYRAYLFPTSGPTVLLIMYYLTFQNSSNLRKFVAGLNYFPYNVAYEKVLGKDELFIRFVIPAYECYNLRNSIKILAEIGCLKNACLFLGDLAHATWDNVEIYQMYKNGAWKFSYGIAMEMLENILSKSTG